MGVGNDETTKSEVTIMANKSALYATMLKVRSELREDLETVDNYFDEGNAKTTVTQYDEQGNVIKKDVMSSKWTTSFGKRRVRTMHKNFVADTTYVVRLSVKKIVVDSPFFDPAEKEQKVRVVDYTNVQVVTV